MFIERKIGKAIKGSHMIRNHLNINASAPIGHTLKHFSLKAIKYHKEEKGQCEIVL